MQNINIVYKVDKSEVERSNQAVQQAKNLTDQLKKSSQQFGDAAAKGNKQASGSIEALKVKMAQLRQQIELTNRSDTARLNTLIKQYQQAKTQVDQFNKSMKEQHDVSKQTTSGINSMTGGFMNMYNAMKLILTAGIVRELVDTTLEAATLAGKVETVGNAFRRQIPQAEDLLFNLRKATRGTVGDLELMQRSLKFQNFGGDVQELPKLLEFAAVRAQQTGESVDYMVNSIVNGIGRKSILILDNLGISASRLKEEMGGAGARFQSTAEITRIVSKIAGEEMEKMGGFAENAGTSVEQLKVSWQELRIELAKKIESGGIIDFAKDTIDGLRNIIQSAELNLIAWARGTNKVILQQQILKTVMEDVDRIKQRTNGTDQEKLDFIQQEINSRVQLIGRYNDNLRALQEEQNVIRNKNPYDDKLDALQDQIVAYQQNRYEVQLTIDKLKSYYKTLQQAPEEHEKEIETIKTLRDKLAELQTKREEGVSIYDTATLDFYQREINLLEDRILKIADNIAWQNQWQKASNASNKAWDEFIEGLQVGSKTIDEITKQFEELTKTFSNLDAKLTLDINANEIFDKYKDVNFEDLEIPVEVVPKVDWKGEQWARLRVDLKQWFADNRDDVITSGIDASTDLLQAVYNQEMEHYQMRIEGIRNFYAEQEMLAGDNENFKKELRLREQRDTVKAQRELAIKQKQARIFSIVVDTAASIAKAWVNPGYPGAIPLSIFLAAQGAAQAAVVSRAPVGFKDGVIAVNGAGTATSDSIPAMLSKGESVMTAKETKSSLNTLKMIRAKQLDDKVVARLAAKARGSDGSMFDDSRLVAASKRIEKAVKSSDLVRKGSLIYEVNREAENFTTYIRSKSIK